MNRREFLERGRELLDEVGCARVTLGLDRAKVRAGAYHTRRHHITLSEHFVTMNEWDPTVRGVLLHEAAHALTPGDDHGPKWRAACRNLGIAPERCYDGDKVAMPEPPWAILCVGCERIVGKRHRRVRLDGRHHTRCAPGTPLRLIANPANQKEVSP